MPQLAIDPAIPEVAAPKTLAEYIGDRNASALGIEIGTFEALSGNPAANTRLTYLYRDGYNYKTRGEVILPGVITPAEIASLHGHLDEGIYFIPGQVGLTDLPDGWDEYVDHPYHELGSISLTLDPASSSVTPAELAREFTLVSWDHSYRS